MICLRLHTFVYICWNAFILSGNPRPTPSSRLSPSSSHHLPAYHTPTPWKCSLPPDLPREDPLAQGAVGGQVWGGLSDSTLLGSSMVSWFWFWCGSELILSVNMSVSTHLEEGVSGHAGTPAGGLPPGTHEGTAVVGHTLHRVYL